MLLVIFKDGSDYTANFNSNQFKYWHWDTHSGNLILGRQCHKGCRVEIPASVIRIVEVSTKAHESQL